ncbi:Polycomb complex protein BMI-1 [Holothuria leucospilota]|uniref:Polycomb complex protein BMI-1 n=1 Tax=Holothuria leucospilota TaxID=206669 RepID=A0A9Q0YMQ4_HOLLE|nr:Polycomb complex protein BMI-1 [Holothuria leucospilota]
MQRPSKRTISTVKIFCCLLRQFGISRFVSGGAIDSPPEFRKMHRKTRLKLTDLNPLLTCSLCKGYLIDATTLTECLHSFCRSCLVRYLQTSKQCPKCDTLVHKTRPLHNASSSRLARSPGNLGVDRALQNIVYKLVPGLFKDEMKKRRDFYTQNPQAGTSSNSSPGDLEARGEVGEEALVIYSDDEHMNLSLEYYLPYRRKLSEEKNGSSANEATKKRTNGDLGDNDDMVHKRYLRCPAAVCVKHIKKFIRNKFDLKPTYQIEITHIDNEDDSLPDDYTLMDVAYIYTWRRNGPLPLVFRVFQEANKKQKTGHVIEPVPTLEQVQEKDDKQVAPPPPPPPPPPPIPPPPTVDPVPPTNQENTELLSNPPNLEKEVVHTKDTEETVSAEKATEKATDEVRLDTTPEVQDSNGESGKTETHVDNSNQATETEFMKAKLDRTVLSNNNEKAEVVKENGQGKIDLSLDLKTGVSTVDAPPTLTAAVPAR